MPSWLTRFYFRGSRFFHHSLNCSPQSACVAGSKMTITDKEPTCSIYVVSTPIHPFLIRPTQRQKPFAAHKFNSWSKQSIIISDSLCFNGMRLNMCYVTIIKLIASVLRNRRGDISQNGASWLCLKNWVVCLQENMGEYRVPADSKPYRQWWKFRFDNTVETREGQRQRHMEHRSFDGIHIVVDKVNKDDDVASIWEPVENTK